MTWSQLKVTCKVTHLDTLCAIMSYIDSSIMIEDYSDIETGLKTVYGDLIDESILNSDKTIASCSIYVSEDKNINEYISFIRSQLDENGIEATIEILGTDEEEWSTAWKKYYKPTHIGHKMVIVPSWEEYTPIEGEIVIDMDPGMAFGTGTHETTRLVIGLLEKYTTPGVRMLDVGTGSGILAICASRLGAGECKAYDIDPMSVRVARENIKDSGLTNITCDQSDLLRAVDLEGGKYGLVCANIVADIIIRMTPDVHKYIADDGVLLASGIIMERSSDVVNCFEQHGFEIVERAEENGWCALAVKLKK